MVINKLGLAVLGLLAFLHPLSAKADGDGLSPAKYQGKNLILIPNQYNTPMEIEPFVATSTAPKEQYLLIDRSVNPKSFSTQTKSSSKSAEDIGDQILAFVPHGDKMKHMWNIVDGDVDLLYVENLRADRKNKGIIYTTKTLPLIGEVSDLEFKFKAGEDISFNFESNRIPLVGEVKGFNLKGSLGNDDSKISARYTIPFD